MSMKAGDKFHLRGPMTIAFTEHESRSLQRGETILVTEELLEMSKDRNGDSWLDLVDDPAAQTARFGGVKFARGECPPDVTWYNETPGDLAWNYARELERERVAAISDPEERAAASRAAREKFGARPTSQLLSSLRPHQRSTYAPSDARSKS